MIQKDIWRNYLHNVQKMYEYLDSHDISGHN